jgi:hypothetical protein
MLLLPEVTRSGDRRETGAIHAPAALPVTAFARFLMFRWGVRRCVWDAQRLRLECGEGGPLLRVTTGLQGRRRTWEPGMFQ